VLFGFNQLFLAIALLGFTAAGQGALPTRSMRPEPQPVFRSTP
jgi:hypothetical protein